MYAHTVPESERKKLIQYIANRNECSVALQVVHLLKMEQYSPALEQKLFREQHSYCEQKPIPINFL